MWAKGVLKMGKGCPQSGLRASAKWAKGVLKVG